MDVKYRLFTVRDSKVHSHLAITAIPTTDAARRWWADLKTTAPFSKHPEDYSLWCVGSMDMESGAITPVTPVEIGE